MKFIFRFLFIVAVCFSTSPATAQCTQNDTVAVFYANGIDNSYIDAQDSSDLLQILVRENSTIFSDCVVFELAFNERFGPASLKNTLSQLAQGLIQREIDFAANFWSYLNGSIAPPSWFEDYWRTAILSATSIFQSDLLAMEFRYSERLAVGNKIVTIAHSQGNLYTNQAFAVVSAAGDGNNLHLISVATPATSVYGDGPYFTLHGDVIRRALGLSPNITNDKLIDGSPSPCLESEILCHSFLGSYIAGDKTQPAILAELFKLLPKVPNNDPDIDPSCAAIDHFEIADLGTGFDPTSLNDTGLVAGRCDGPLGQACLFDGRDWRRLGTLNGPWRPGTGASTAWGINNSNDIIGSSQVDIGVAGFVPTRAFGAFSVGGHSLLDLGSLGGNAQSGSMSEAAAINNSGLIAGSSQTLTGQWHAVVYESGSIRDLGTLPGRSNSRATGINASGAVIGDSSFPGRSAFLYGTSGMLELFPFATSLSRANDLNDLGHVVGVYFPSDQVAGEAFIWKSGAVTLLNKIGGGSVEAEALSVNNSGYVVGLFGNIPFLHDGNTSRDINELIIQSPGWRFDIPSQINNRCQIVGIGTLNGEGRGILLTPVIRP